MCLTAGIAYHPNYALLATDLCWFSAEETDSGAPASRQDRGGKLVKMAGTGWATASGCGFFAGHALERLRQVDPTEPARVSEVLRSVAHATPARKASWVTVIFHDGARFRGMTFNENGEVLAEGGGGNVDLRFTWPRGLDQEETQILETGVTFELRHARTDSDLLAAIGRLFKNAAARTEWVGADVDGVLLYRDRAGTVLARRFDIKGDTC